MSDSLIVVSNRVPSLANGQCTGGLAVALKAAFEEMGGIWFGWSGQIAEQPKSLATLTRTSGFSLATIDLSEQEYQGFYEQHANRGLWPLCHGRLDLTSFDHESYALYRQVNRRFASVLAAPCGDDDMIWAHDYHLIPLAAELRRLGVGVPLGFFLHIPFPQTETLAALPWHRELLKQLSAYDLVGFQTTNCLRNFRDALERHLTGEAGVREVSAPGHLVRAGRYPIGIDTEAFANLAASPEAQRWCERFRVCMQDRTWAVGVERLDYTKGLAERLLAFETLLERSPELQGRRDTPSPSDAFALPMSAAFRVSLRGRPGLFRLTLNALTDSVTEAWPERDPRFFVEPQRSAGNPRTGA